MTYYYKLALYEFAFGEFWLFIEREQDGTNWLYEIDDDVYESFDEEFDFFRVNWLDRDSVTSFYNKNRQGFHEPPRRHFVYSTEVEWTYTPRSLFELARDCIESSFTYYDIEVNETLKKLDLPELIIEQLQGRHDFFARQVRFAIEESTRMA